MNGIIWSSALVYLFLAVGLFYIIATRFLQVRLIKDMVTVWLEPNQALCENQTALKQNSEFVFIHRKNFVLGEVERIFID